MAGIIEMNNVCFSAQGHKLVNNVSFNFEEGMATALVGPSGGGKSTVLKLAAGLFPPDEGEVLFRGKDIARMGRQENLLFRREAAVVFQDSALWANQTLFQILELPLQVHFPSMSKDEREKRIESVVAEVGYKRELGIRPDQLSMGEQKLIAFARALICRPRLLFLDEWTESLDQNSSDRLVGMVKVLKADGVSIILVSHNMPIIRDLADIAVMILGGQIFLKLTREQMDADEDLSRYIERGMAS
ncbi:MAG: ATP-binding cassette domain-containing protein [Treponema sp.]|jgi:ABC-type multidrug transport system ATPase subunit|nr:ATP-binding cassette domain-containing protein [Treponema sp.]